MSTARVRALLACILVACILCFSLLSSSAQAQAVANTDQGTGAAPDARGGGGGKHRGGGKQAEAQKPAPRADEKASHAAIEALPDKKYDPWQSMR